MNLIHEFCKISCNKDFTHSCGCSSSTYLFLLLLFYPARCLSRRPFFPSNSLIHFFLIHVLLTGTQVLFQDSLRSSSLSACCPFQFFHFFFFCSEQLLVFHQFCFLFWVYPGCSEYLLSMTTQLCFSISLQYPTQYRYGIRRNQLIERICIAAQVDELYRVQKFDYYQLN